MSSCFALKTYRDEPIIITDAQIKNLTPPKYRAMRKIAMSGRYCPESDEKIFYKQGKFMEDFEDNIDYQGEFMQYFPTYQSMNNQQLRGYFTWRTKVRHGVIRKTSLSFVFVYLYELINQIGVSSPEEGFHVLKNFWMVYKEIDFRINSYAKCWLKDYAIYYNLDKSLLEEGLSGTNFDDMVLTLFDYKSRNADEVFSALNSLASYKLQNSRFFKQYPDDVKTVVYAVFSALSDYYEKNRAETLCEKFFGKFCTSSYYIFSSAVFYDRIRHKNFVYEINDLHRYRCKNRRWSRESFIHYGGWNRQIGDLLKAIDFFMRKKYNFKYALKMGKTTKALENIISKAIDAYQENQKKAARPQIKIDVSKLQDIRKASLETQGKLLVEEELEVPGAPAFFDKKSKNDIGLSDIEYLFMKCLLYGRTYNDPAQSKGLPVSVLVDAINEKFFDRFGDIVIIETEDRPEPVADYMEELKKILQKWD